MTAPRVAVTGAGGFLGWHLRVHALASGVATITPIDRQAMGDEAALAEVLSSCDAVIHAAGVNRGGESDLEAGNVELARGLVRALDRAGARPRVVYANSIHAGTDSPYGRGKAHAESVFSSWALEVGVPFLDVRLPNLFGEHGRPDYNSVVATFCRRVADDVDPEVHGDPVVRLLHAQDAAGQLLAAAIGDAHNPAPEGRMVRVRDILDLLRQQRDTYREGDIPAFGDVLELQLFNSLRSALFPASYPINPTPQSDQRGSLHECVRSHGAGGQTFVSSTLPGQTRGEHFHLRKIERFHVLRGEAEISLRRLCTDDVVRFRVDGSRPAIVDMPTMWAHNIRNTGDAELLTLFWSDQLYDPADPDTYPEIVDRAVEEAALT